MGKRDESGSGKESVREESGTKWKRTDLTKCCNCTCSSTHTHPRLSINRLIVIPNYCELFAPVYSKYLLINFSF